MGAGHSNALQGAFGWQVPPAYVHHAGGALRIMRPDTWYGQAMASFDKEEFKARLQKMSTDEIHEKLRGFNHREKSVAIDELAARARDEELKAWTRKKSARRTVVLCAVVLAVFAVITLIYLAQL